MNSLSWFLWLSEVASRIYGIAQFWGVVFSLALMVMIIVAIITSFYLTTEGGAKEKDEAMAARRLSIKLGSLFMFLAFVCGIIYSAIPSQRTLNTILASEVAERLANTTIATEIGADAQEILRGYLKKLKDGLKEDSK